MLSELEAELNRLYTELYENRQDMTDAAGRLNSCLRR